MAVSSALSVALSAGLLLAACGGGGDDTPPPPAAPVVALQVQPVKVFRFTWADVADASEYRLLEDADATDAQAGYEAVASIAPAVGRHDLVVSLPLRMNARYVLQACNAGGCTDSAAVAVSGSLAGAVGYVKASNTGAGDEFGGAISPGVTAVALSADGSTLAVGAWIEDSSATGVGGDQADDSAPNSGAVYVFRRRGVAWSQEAYLKASNTAQYSYFGASVALSADGNTLAVGSSWERSGATGIDGDQRDTSAPESGAVYVFTRSADTWAQQAYVKASNTDARDYFGLSVALSGDGNTMAVGAMWEQSNATGLDGDQDDNSMSLSGAIYVFERNGATWSQRAYVKASNTGMGANFGRAVAVSGDGNTLAVGALGEFSAATGIDGNQSDASAPGSGAVYVFARSERGAPWSQQAYVKASNTGAGDLFGVSVALSADGHTLAVGALMESSNATGVDGDQADNSAPSSGAVYVFARQGTTWSQQAYLKASNTDASDDFGGSLALSADGRTLAVGASAESSSATGLNGDQSDNSAGQSGAVYLFTRTGTTWRQQAYVKATNTGAGDGFGASIALSGDGQTLAAGAARESSDARGLGGDADNNAARAAGAVYLY